MRKTYDNCISILESALNENISITKASSNQGLTEGIIRNYSNRCLDNDLKRKEINKKEYQYFVELYNNVKSRKIVNVSSTETKIVDLELDEKFDDRSTSWEERDSDGKILKYKFKILVRDEDPFIGDITREQMEIIYQNYPYVTRNNVSSYFPAYTFVQFKRIIRTFNITKDHLFPKHWLEEKNPDTLSELALKAKAHAGYKKIIENKPLFIEKELRETQKKLLELENDKDYIDNLLDKYFNNKTPKVTPKKFSNKKNVSLTDVAYCFFSDIHYGKKFDRPIFGRGYNKEIAHERIMQIAEKTVQYCNVYNPKKLIIGFFGDLIENFLESGFHEGQILNQDLHQDDQIFYAVDSIKECLLYIYENLSNDIKIELHTCHGNHDRMSENRSSDKNRTPAKIAFKILQRELKDYIEIVMTPNNMVNVKNGDIQLIGFHGDNNLIKRKPSELVNLYGAGNTAYHLVISGHYHRAKIESGTNYMTISLPSVASVDEFILEDLGLNNLPAFILGKQTHNQKSFDYTYINLY